MPIAAKDFIDKHGRSIVIRDIAESDAAPFLRVLNEVCAEEKWMLRSRFDMTPLEEREFICEIEPPDLYIIAAHNGAPVGWVTLFQLSAPYCRHIAELGMGIKDRFRNAGIGSALMQATLEWAREAGLEKITLGVRASNSIAIGLYRKFGFVEEGRQVAQVKHNGMYDDEYLMAYFVK